MCPEATAASARPARRMNATIPRRTVVLDEFLRLPNTAVSLYEFRRPVPRAEEGIQLGQGAQFG
jgi:hypothetical protein